MITTESQRSELEEYLETILDLYTKDEYEDMVESIVFQFCKRKFGWERKFSVKLFYEIANEYNK
jgi:hypothetical protein